jgi:hypothetical protein
MQHDEEVDLVSASTNDAVIRLSRTEVLALRSLLEYAPSAPLELIGPKPIFGRLLDEFEAVIDTVMSSEHERTSLDHSERFDDLNHLYASLVRLLGIAKPLPGQSTEQLRVFQLPSTREVYDEVARLKALAEPGGRL